MCGLFAGVGKLNSNRMIALGSMSEERGTDSVGLAYIRENRMQIAKVASRPCVGLNVELKKQVTEAAIAGMFIGHTRQATQGAVTAQNAHPFLVDGIAFAHNGIIINDSDFGKFEVDSESLIFGIKSKDFSKYEGAIALVWIENGLLHAYRCGNPLYRGKFNGTTYLASDEDYLEAIGCTKVKQLTEGMIYTFHNSHSLTTERVPKNKAFVSTYQAHKPYTYNSWEDYLEDRALERQTNSGFGTALTPSVKQERWWEEEKRMDEEIKQAREDFRTPSDIAKETETPLGVDRCDACGELAELADGYCLECIMWLDENGISVKNPSHVVRAKMGLA